MILTVVVEIDVETNDQPVKDVRSRLANRPHRVGHWIKDGAVEGAKSAIAVAWPESYFPDWPENGRVAEVVAVRQHTEGRA